MKKIVLGQFRDDLTQSDYELVRFESAKAVSDALKDTYNKKGIDYKIFNSYTASDPDDYDTKQFAKKQGKTIENPPLEIYEYQNFFLMENDKGEYLLLDGFRRLLYYKPIETPIIVRIYKQADLTNSKILSLLIYLNHFKMIGNSGGEFFDRGFALLLHSIFDLNIHPYSDAFVNYLNGKKATVERYSFSFEEKVDVNVVTKERIINPHFIADIRFIQELNKSGDHMINEYFGALVYEFRSNSDKDFDLEFFKKEHKEHELIQNLMVSYKKYWLHNGEIGKKVIVQILNLYRNIFIKMEGGTVEQTYSEILDDCKKQVALFKKDKNLLKITGNRKDYIIKELLLNAVTDKKKLKFKVIVYPESGIKDGQVTIRTGLHEDFKITKVMVKNHWGGTIKTPVIGKKDGDNIWEVSRLLGTKTENSSIRLVNNSNSFYYAHKIDLFVEGITAKDVENWDNKRKSH